MEVTVGTTTLKLKTLGAVQVIDLLLKGARKRYMANAKELAEELQGREKAAYMAEVLRGLNALGEDDAEVYAQTIEAMSALVAKSAGISRDKATQILTEASEDELKEIMGFVSPSGDGDEKEMAFKDAVDAVLSARLDGDREKMDEAVEECIAALRSVSVIGDAGKNVQTSDE